MVFHLTINCLKFKIIDMNKKNFKSFVNKWFIGQLAVFALVLIIDLVSKQIVENTMVLNGEGVDVIKGFLGFKYIHNDGMAFGTLGGQRALFITLTLIVVPLMGFFTVKFRNFGKTFTYTMSVIIAGAIGNMIDRIAFGYVRDFIEFQFVNFAIFNIADVALTCGAVVLLVYLLFFCKALKSDKKTTEAPNVNSNNECLEPEKSCLDEKVENSVDMVGVEKEIKSSDITSGNKADKNE